MKDIMRILKLFGGYRLWIIAGIGLSLLASLAAIILMGASGWFISAMGIAGIAGVTLNYFTPAAIIRACAIVRTVGRYLERITTHEATFRIIARLRGWFYGELLNIRFSAIGKMRSGDVIARLRGDIDVLERFYLGFVVPFAVGIFGITLVTAFFISSNLAMGLAVGFLLMTGGLALPLIAFLKTRRTEDMLVTQDAEMRTRLSENLQGLDEFLVYDVEGQHAAAFHKLALDKAVNQSHLNFISNLLQNGIILLTALALVCVFIIIIPSVHAGENDPAMLAMFALLAIACFDLITPLPAAFQGLGAVMRAARRIFEITDQADHSVGEKPRFFHSAPMTIGFRHVSFSYSDNAEPVLKDTTFTLAQGEKIAITGATGTGKSSIVNLLLRFYDPQQGQITINDMNIGDYDAESIRALFAVLPQHPYIFAKSVRENISLGNSEITQQDIETAARKAGLHEHIISLPQGYDTPVGEHGHTLSGGQKRRLGLARALVIKAPCLILDEPGEGLDYAMEEEILNAIIDHLDGASLILISHRAAGAERMDKIINLD